MMNRVKMKEPRRRRRLSAARAAAFAAFALAALCLPGAASAQWTAPDAQGNIYTTNTGNVGIGTTAPSTQLELRVPSGDVITRFSNAGGATGSLDLRYKYESAQHRMGLTDGNGQWMFYTQYARSNMDSIGFFPGRVGIGTGSPAYLLDVSGSSGTPFRVRDSAGREYFSTSTRTGPFGTIPVVSIGTGRLIVDNTGPDGNNDTILRHLVNNMVFYPSDHPDLPGNLVVVQKGGNYAMVIDQRTNGNVSIGTKLNVAGDVTVAGNINAKYQDVAEWVPSTQKLNAGTVVVLDVERDNHVAASSSSYDTRVAGVVSAQPGISLGEAGEGKVLVATTGRVKVRVDATKGAIKVGDLLVTSDVEGLAMKSEPVQLGGRQMHAPGTIIGKALQSLAGGKGEILVLLSLQ